MNLLVTNTRNAQAYAIIRALRPHARKIVVTMEGDNRLAARLAHAANSRLVDKRYFTPSPAKDWQAGKIQPENTADEAAYIDAIKRICERERIDTIFPSFDPHVYVFAKNKACFKTMGIVIPVPDYEVVVVPLDKYRTIRAAEAVGFPCPRTLLPDSESDLAQIATEIGFPLVVKARYSSGRRGTLMVNDLGELVEKVRALKKSHGMPLIQEYIPGGCRTNFHLLIDREGRLISIYSGRNLRGSRISGGYGTGQESIVPHPYVIKAAELVSRLGWWGGTLVETLVDPRDGLPKLLEINPRFGNRLWVKTEFGINLPLLCVKSARGEAIEVQMEYPPGTAMVDPVEDLLLLGFHFVDLVLFRWRVGVLGKIPVDFSLPPLSLRQLARSYAQTYFGSKRKLWNPYFKHFFQDPLVSVLWWSQYFFLILRALKFAGR